MIKRRILRAIAVASTALLALSACSSGVSGTAEEGKTLVLSLNQAESHPSYIALTSFGERVKERTGGRWDIKVYPNETLGAQQEVIQLVSDGSVDMAVASGTQLENLNPDFATLNLPTVFKSIDHQMKVVGDDNIVGELFSSLEESKNLTVVGGLTQGDRNIYTVAGPVTEPEDLRGMKIRVQESDIHIAMINAMGGSATPMSYGEVYTALQSGVLDGAENNEVSYVSQKHNEVAKHVALTRHLVGLDYMLINSDLIKSMNPEDRKIFDEEWQQTVTEHVELWNTQNDAAIASAKKSGSKFNEVDTAAFTKALKPVVDNALTTDDAHKLYDNIQEAAK
ncbi:TRAP transporter substrate-binding protein [Glutamicibacter sp.]|uniref:TRAP transporter substrate-binding protein n=1 Tax=Glutamicibacter sp. TaxID=1931995 RepID=UPI002B474164|nr:TRAP transporter substrate-binding protein [Glutamicibacter sp.]HJX77489.1 TRAP transporter substrate-binding protein [Glutamicibacter sp.]